MEIKKRPQRLQELANWTRDWREAWGRRANELDEAGVPWPQHEITAFDEVKALKAKGGKPPLPTPPKPKPEQETKHATDRRTNDPRAASPAAAGTERVKAGTLNLKAR